MASDEAASGKLRKYDKGELLIRENELSRKMFVLHKGKVRVYKTYMSQKVTLAILSEGEIFGEMSFFDARPRSATVEALTSVEVYVIDAEEANRQLATLPEWVKPVFRTVFNRLRATDTKTTLLQASNEFEKRHFKRDSFAQRLYKELLRFNSLLLLVYDESTRDKAVAKRDEMLNRLDDVLGDRALPLQAYWKLLEEFDFIDRGNEETSGKVELRVPAVREWLLELHNEIDAGTYTLLSHSSVALLKRVISRMDPRYAVRGRPDHRIVVSHEELDLGGMPLLEEALEELEKKGLVVLRSELSFSVVPSAVFKAYHYQSLLKSFDHGGHQI